MTNAIEVSPVVAVCHGADSEELINKLNQQTIATINYRRQLDDVRAELEAAQSLLQKRSSELEAIINSRSWRLAHLTMRTLNFVRRLVSSPTRG